MAIWPEAVNGIVRSPSTENGWRSVVGRMIASGPDAISRSLHAFTETSQFLNVGGLASRKTMAGKMFRPVESGRAAAHSGLTARKGFPRRRLKKAPSAGQTFVQACGAEHLTRGKWSR
jgi:hypothetical protein